MWYHAMTVERPTMDREQIRAEVKGLQAEIWKRRSQIWDSPPGPLDMLNPAIAAREILGLRYEEPQEIGQFSSESGLSFEVAGLLDRPQRLIVVARKFPLEHRNFTGAHEVGHWLLHPKEVILHRDRPITGEERQRPRIEREADWFAADFLMPPALLEEHFERRFGSPAETIPQDDEAAGWFSIGMGEKITASQLTSSQRKLAICLASTSFYQNETFSPLSDEFRVSPTAMAIQLEDLGFGGLG